MKKRRFLRIQPLPAALLLGMLVFDPDGWVAATLAAALLHEVGHLLAAYCLGIPVAALRTDFFGARLEVRGRMLSYGEEWLLSAAGPLTSLLVALAGGLLWRVSPFFFALSGASILLGIFNLLPIATLDGGRMLEVLLLSILVPARAEAILRLCSFAALFLLWSTAVYILLRTGDGGTLLFFSMSLFLHFFKTAEYGLERISADFKEKTSFF